MRANMKLQAVQPLMKDIQERYKNDPQRLQQEMFKLYKEHKVNPLGGCWPMLLPMPVLFALFFVFQNAIELRGALVPLDPRPLAAGPALHHPGADGRVSMYVADQDRADGDGAESADEDDAVHDAGDDDGACSSTSPSGLNLYYAVQQHREHPAAVAAREGAEEAHGTAIVDVKTGAPEARRAAKAEAGRA